MDNRQASSADEASMCPRHSLVLMRLLVAVTALLGIITLKTLAAFQPSLAY